MIDLHRHDEFSSFDGFGKASELAELAKALGYTSLATTNHGNTNGLVATYKACKEHDIKAILGVEGYFLPKYKEKSRGYHLLLVAKNLVGYGNLNRIQYEGDKQKYYNPIWDFEILEKYSEGVICTTACVAGYLGQAIIKDNYNAAEKFLLEMKRIFKDDFYIEVQPYKISEEGVQEKINIESIRLGKKLGIKCILTSDSHRGKREDFDTYMKMHEIANHAFTDVELTYEERYMPEPDELLKRFKKMHSADYTQDEMKKILKEFKENTREIEDKCDDNYLDKLPLRLPKLHDESGKTSTQVVIQKVKEGLKKRGKLNKDYIDRCKKELSVIKHHGFEDYFLIVADYVSWAKANGIAVGPGRGSVCNSLVAYALGITEVDSLYFNLDFRRFLRKDKASVPDIDLDFQTSRRGEVIEYLTDKFEGHAARISSYGLYKVDNLLNDLAKICGLPTTKDVDDEIAKVNKITLARIKKKANEYIFEDTKIDIDGMMSDPEVIEYNKNYKDIFVHFTKLFRKVRYIGTHAAGVAITDGDLLDYAALKTDKNGDVATVYDLGDVDSINLIKFDVLGLKTMESISDLRRLTGVTVNYEEIANDQKLIEQFAQGKTDGIFQFERETARKILINIHTDGFNDVVAASSMNRPGPLGLKMPEMYADGKANVETAMQSRYWDYTSESYGTIVYQEQLQQICINIGKMSWPDADKVMKVLKGGTATAEYIRKVERDKKELMAKFVKGALQNGYTKDEAKELFEKMLVYSFNKGHAVGYTLISFEEMFYKVYYPTQYWQTKMKYALNDQEYAHFTEQALNDGIIIFLPHINYSEEYTTIRSIEGEDILQQGMAEIKGVGEKAANYIHNERKQNGIFKNYDDFYDRCKSRVVTSRTIDILKNTGALEFNKKVYLQRVTKYNSALYSRALKRK